MNLSFRISILCLLCLGLAACTKLVTSAEGSKPMNATPDLDAHELIALSEKALSIAQKESAQVILRQVDTDLNLTDFRFVDTALTEEIMVVIPEPGAPSEKWSSVVTKISPLISPGGAIDLHSLKVGPNRVAQAITARWPGCGIRGITLYYQDDRLTWVAFCNTPEGVVSGTMDNQTEVFQPSDAPPGSVPVTATPAP